jgi:hypothetical protein
MSATTIRETCRLICDAAFQATPLRIPELIASR